MCGWLWILFGLDVILSCVVSQPTMKADKYVKMTGTVEATLDKVGVNITLEHRWYVQGIGTI